MERVVGRAGEEAGISPASQATAVRSDHGNDTQGDGEDSGRGRIGEHDRVAEARERAIRPPCRLDALELPRYAPKDRRPLINSVFFSLAEETQLTRG